MRWMRGGRLSTGVVCAEIGEASSTEVIKDSPEMIGKNGIRFIACLKRNPRRKVAFWAKDSVSKPLFPGPISTAG